ncbi:hypothetical protein ruthe_01723, partial [Rubellimicrobium thermophilum DSM 16684]
MPRLRVTAVMPLTAARAPPGGGPCAPLTAAGRTAPRRAGPPHGAHDQE